MTLRNKSSGGNKETMNGKGRNEDQIRSKDSIYCMKILNKKCTLYELGEVAQWLRVPVALAGDSDPAPSTYVIAHNIP